MPETQNPRPEELLEEYLDGELPEDREEQLFYALAQNGELRAQMRDHLALRTMVQSDAKQLVPPLDITRGVFAALGFTAPLAPVPVPVSAPSRVLPAFLRRMWLPAVSIIVGSTALFLFLNHPSTVPASGAAAPAVAEQNPAPPAEGRDANAVADLGARPAETAVPLRHSAPAAPRPSRTDVPDTRDVPATTADHGATVSGIDARPAEPFAIPAATTDPRGLQSFGALRYEPAIRIPVGVSLRRGSASSTPSSALPSQSNPFFLDCTLGIAHPLSARHAVGVEFGAEAFAQHYDGMEDGVPVIYEQHPVEYWFAATYRYTPGPLLLDNLSPFAQADLGGALQIGPLGKILLGMQYRVVPGLAMTLAAEGTTIYYRFQQQWFNTRKLGFTYGFTLGF